MRKNAEKSKDASEQAKVSLFVCSTKLSRLRIRVYKNPTVQFANWKKTKLSYSLVQGKVDSFYKL